MRNPQQGKRADEKSRWARGNVSRMEGGGKQIEAWGRVVVLIWRRSWRKSFLQPGRDSARGMCSFWDSCMFLCTPQRLSVGGRVSLQRRKRRASTLHPLPSFHSHLLLFVILHTAAARLDRSDVDNERSGRLRLVFNNGSANIRVLQPALPQGSD